MMTVSRSNAGDHSVLASVCCFIGWCQSSTYAGWGESFKCVQCRSFYMPFFFSPPCVGHFFRAYYSKNCWNLLPSVIQWKVKSTNAWQQYPLLTKLFYKRLLQQLRCSVLRVVGACGFFIVKLTCYSGRKMLG